MDGPSLLPFMVIVAGAIFLLPRFASSVEATSDLLSQLFVPPDRALGWPHGVQESDEPWAWRSVPPPTLPEVPDDEDVPTLVEIFEIPPEAAVLRHGLVVDLRRVRPERPRAIAA